MANGLPIENYAFKNPPSVNISYAQLFDEHQARIWAGLSLEEYHALPGAPRWVDPETGGMSKAEVLMLYRMHHRIHSVSQDAQTKRRR